MSNPLNKEKAMSPYHILQKVSEYAGFLIILQPNTYMKKKQPQLL